MSALFFDIDGTILDSKTHSVPKSTIQSLKMAKERGHLLFINTGRTACDIPDEIEALPFDGYCCGCGTYIRYGEQILFQSVIPNDRGAEIVDYMRELGISGVLEGTEDVYFQDVIYENEEIEDFRKHAAIKGNGITHTLEEPGLRYDKLILCSRDKKAVKRFAAFVEQDIRVLDYGNGFYECIQKAYSKASAIKWLQNYLELADDELYVFGDSANDMDMFVCVKHAVAMGNHDRALEQEAEYVTDTVERDGIKKALEHYGLI